MALYHDIAAKLTLAPGDGGPAVEGRLPVQEELAALYGVGMGTVHRAIVLLKQRGEVYTTHAGTYVGARPPDPRCP